MSIICNQCGGISPDSSNFCQRCGSLFSELEIQSAQQRLLEPECIRCGEKLIEGGTFCPKCGSSQDQRTMRIIANEIMRKTMTAKFLALIPGIFYIFGLGHIYLRSYGKAVFFIALSSLIYLGDWVITERELVGSVWQNGLLVFSLLIFMAQLWDVFRMSNKIERTL